ncbi:type III polyketide synthase [Rhodohalobacter halophilus]|uniref:type III polyketide synthase n=1 Tax=Rhodohalobacter halophilus TaxID=1812810 RepID=UPI00083FB2AF|nr:type III polyketide synthase [Rhodohalobacter halophilus]
MSAFVHTILTAVPKYSYHQEELRDRMKEIVPGSERDKRIIHHIYSRSGINTRYSVVDDFRKTANHQLFFNGQGATPGTASRNDTYIREGRKLFVEVAQKLINQSRFSSEDITHLITVSCTGFYTPGPDYDIIKSLGMSPKTERYHLGFMGCYAAIPALKMANQICLANPKANVMIVSVELCTLHFQANPKMDDLLSASVFADGGAGAIVSNRKLETSAFQIDAFASAITDKGKDDMAWSIGDTGFNMVLSNYIPELLEEGLEPFLSPVLDQYQLELSDINLWGVHPGGRAILDNVEKTLLLTKDALSASRQVLSDYGNMSSATVLFVLKKLLEENNTNGRTLTMAFGPGLTLESALLTKIPGS